MLIAAVFVIFSVLNENVLGKVEMQRGRNRNGRFFGLFSVVSFPDR